MTRTGPPEDGGGTSREVDRRGLLAVIGVTVATAGCAGFPPGSEDSFETPESVVTVYLRHHPLATSMSPDEYSERARSWWHSRSQFFNGLEEAMSNPFGGEGSGSEDRTVKIVEMNTAARDLSSEQLLGLDPNVGVSGSIGDFADEETALVDTVWRFESDTEYSSELESQLETQVRYLTAVENDQWQILTSI